MVWLDLETFSTIPIDTGVYKYAEDARILLCAYAFDDAPALVYDATSGAPWPVDLLHRLADPRELIVAHNSNFDRTILRRYLPHVGDPTRWRDSMIMAASLSLPCALLDLCAVCHLPADKSKDADGKRLIRLFCRPQSDGSVITGKDRPDDWARFVNYCRLDVESMRAAVRALPAHLLPSAQVWREWTVDQIINDRGMYIDRELVHAAVAACAQAKLDADATISRITRGAVATAGQLDALISFMLTEYGYTLPDMQASTLQARLDDPALPEEARELIATRLAVSKASVKKFEALQNSCGRDGRLRGCLQFMGALRTGRWTGRIFQPQNLPRGTMTPAEVEEGVSALKSGLASVLYDNVTALVSNCLRAAICAPKGRKLVVADLSNIEGRVLSWLAGEEWKLEAFRLYDAGKGPDLYKVAYARTFGIRPEEVTKKQRQIGKVLELAMGYQGGVGAFVTFARGYGVDLDEMAEHVRASCPDDVWKVASDASGRAELGDLSVKAWTACEAVKTLWRRAHPAISRFWASAADAAGALLRGVGATSIPAGRVRFFRSGSYLVVRLPSGRPLCYPAARATSGRNCFEYYGQIQATRRWDYIGTYAGKIVENITQATARDILASSLPAVEEAGYAVVLSVHDELITEVPDDPRFSAAELSRIMATAPEWAPGLPLSAAGFEAYRYKKD